MQTTTLQERAVLVRLSLSCFNITRTDKKVTEEVLKQHLAGKDSGKFQKFLVPREAIEPIVKHQTEWRQWHYDRTLPWKDSGVRLLPTMGLVEYNEGTRNRRTKHEVLIAEFISKWPAYKAEARVALNGMFNEGDYPHDDDIKHKFGALVEFSPVPSGGDFRVNVTNDMLDEMRRSTNDAVTQAQEMAVKDVWQRLSDPLLHLANKLRDKDGKFRDSIVSNLLEVAELAPKLNVLNDPKLNQFADEIRKAFSGTDPDALRDNRTVRKQAMETADEILSRLSGYVTA